MRILRKDLTIDIGPPIVGTIEIISLFELWDQIERAVAVVEISLRPTVFLHAEIVWTSISAEETVRKSRNTMIRHRELT